MDLPAKFIAYYECVECGEAFDVEGMYFPEVTLPCDECGERTLFKAKGIVAISVWGTVEDKID